MGRHSLPGDETGPIPAVKPDGARHALQGDDTREILRLTLDPPPALARPKPTWLRRGSAWVGGQWHRLPRGVRGTVRAFVLLALAVVLAAGIPFGWTQTRAAGHLYEESDLTGSGGPRADVVIVFGAQIAPDGTTPMLFLQGRLDTAAALIAADRAKVILVSGDANGTSGNETAVMTQYLVNVGVPRTRIVADPYGLDTYDTCVRATQVYGVTKALLVTQGYHVARAVTLCRHAGIDADGISARCDGCRTTTLAENTVREYFACSKAAWDAYQDRPPTVLSPPSTEVTDALDRLATT